MSDVSMAGGAVAQRREVLQHRRRDRCLTRLKLDTGTLIIFARRPGIPAAADRTRVTREQTPEGRTITLMRA
jgi:hypothetical protein